MRSLSCSKLLATDAGAEVWRAIRFPAPVLALAAVPAPGTLPPAVSAPTAGPLWAILGPAPSGASGLGPAGFLALVAIDPRTLDWHALVTVPGPRQTPRVTAQLVRLGPDVGDLLVLPGPGAAPPFLAPPFLETTSDDGAAWHQLSDPCPPADAFTEEFAASSGRVLWLMCGSQPAAGSQLKAGYRSDDGGRRWTRLFADAARAAAGGQGRAPSPSVSLGTLACWRPSRRHRRTSASAEARFCSRPTRGRAGSSG